MITTKFYCTIQFAKEEDMLTRVVEMPYKVTVGEELFALDEESWRIRVKRTHFNLATMQLEVALETRVYEHDIKRDDEMAELVAGGWEARVRVRDWQVRD